MLGYAQKTLAEAAGQWRYLPRAVKLAFEGARQWTLAWVTLVIVQGFLPLATVLLTRTLVNSATEAVNGRGIRPVVMAAELVAWRPRESMAGSLADSSCFPRLSLFQQVDLATAANRSVYEKFCQRRGGTLGAGQLVLRGSISDSPRLSTGVKRRVKDHLRTRGAWCTGHHSAEAC
ncbi:MAG: hypothetical protein LAQ30_29460 [Acidobacteriia bacterium]|nr:hypothetical protein [Terriglobia bacterium]